MEMVNKIPWSKSSVIAQLIILLFTIVYVSILFYLFLPWIFLIIYFSLWFIFIILNHRYVCRDCKYHGKFCGSFGLGILSLFKASGKEQFDHKKAKRCIILFTVIFLYPFVVLFFIPPYWIWSLFYIILVILTFFLHQRLGCKKCDLIHCSANPKYNSYKEKKIEY